jgi:hypothetical protein
MRRSSRATHQRSSSIRSRALGIDRAWIERSEKVGEAGRNTWWRRRRQQWRHGGTGQPWRCQTAAKPVPGHTRHRRGRRTPRVGEEEHISGDCRESVGVCKRRTRARADGDELDESTRMSRRAVTRCVVRAPWCALVRPELAGARRRPWQRRSCHANRLGD